MTRPLYIFNLDGTLAFTNHRQHILENKKDRQRWHKYFAASVNDTPNVPVIHTLEHLRKSCDLWIWTGRSQEVRPQTIQWLALHTDMQTSEIDSILRMRRLNDFRPDNQIKTEWLEQLSVDDRRRLVAVFDDRDTVVAAWRNHGVTCFQVAPGNF